MSILSFGLLAGLLLLGEAVVLHVLRADRVDQRIDFAGRQRMLAQRLSTLALSTSRTLAREDLEDVAAELRATSEELARSLRVLREGDEELGLEASEDLRITSSLAAMEGRQEGLGEAVAALLDNLGGDADAGGGVRRRLVAGVTEAVPGYIAGMDAMVDLYEEESREYLAMLERLTLAISAVTILALVLTGVFVFRPSISRIERGVEMLLEKQGELEEAQSALRARRQRLEVAVEERTRELNEQAQRLELAMEFGEAGSWDWYVQDGRVVWDRRTERIHGLEPGTFAGTYEAWVERVHPEDMPEVRAGIEKTLESNAPYSVEYRARGPHAGWSHLAVRGELVRDELGRPLRMVGLVQDVSPRKEMEAAMTRLNEDLRARAVELARSNDELEQFAYVASHDLQEPLRMVTSYVQLLERRCGGTLDDSARDFIRFAVDGTARMKTLINDLLTYSRLGRGRDPVPVDVGDVLGQVEANLEVSIRESGAQIEREGELPTVLADPVQVLQLLQNLIGNAIKYGGVDALHISIGAEEDGGFWAIRVRDNGVGIDPRHHERIFKVFQRLHDGRDSDGTGIGLAICRRIVERHGGDVWLESRPGAGSTFCFTLPKVGHETAAALEVGGMAGGAGAGTTVGDGRSG